MLPERREKRPLPRPGGFPLQPESERSETLPAAPKAPLFESPEPLRKSAPGGIPDSGPE